MDRIKSVAKNKKAFRAYEILDKLEAGIVLQGTEIKSIREGNVSFRDSFIDIRIHGFNSQPFIIFRMTIWTFPYK